MSDTAGFAAAIVTLSSVVEPIQEATIGYRKRLIEMGMGPDAADQCAVTYHGWLIGQLPSNHGQGAKAGGR